MNREEELNQLRMQLATATTNYVSAVEDLKSVANSIGGTMTPQTMADWETAFERRKRMEKLYDGALEKYSKALTSSQQS
jgi:hypothetical protein